LLISAIKLALEGGGNWAPPPEYLKPNVAATIARILLSHRHTA